MKVGIDARFLTHPQRGGFKTYTHLVVTSLAKADSSNHYILYADRPPARPFPLPENFALVPVCGPNSIVREQILVPLAMRRDRVDLAHFPCNTAPVLSGPRMAVTIHDAIALRRPRNGPPPDLRHRLLRAYWRLTIPRGARRASLVITDSGRSRDDLCAALDLDASLIRVVHLAIDPVFGGAAPQIRPAEMKPGTRFILGFASADGRKNHAGVMRAYSEVAPAYSGLELAIVCAHPAVRRQIECVDGVVPLGPVSLEELLWLYGNAAALVFPSLDEGFGLPPLEAMACGTPVVASSTACRSEILGDCAVYVNPAEPADIAEGIRLVMNDGSLRSDLVRRGREHAARFSCEHMGRELVAAYSEAASGRVGAPAG